jgi:hypothetical protein
MKTNILCLTCLIFCVGEMLSAQEHIVTGKIIEAEQGVGLSQVTLSLKEKNQSVLTDANGYYNWKLADVTDNDSVHISCVGYFTIGRIWKEMKGATLMLSPQNYVLSEVTLRKKKPKTKLLNGFNIRQYGERDRIPDLGERQTDMIGRRFSRDAGDGKFNRLRSVDVLQEAFQSADLSAYRTNQHWRFRLRIVEAEPNGYPSERDLLRQRVILTVSDVDYRIFDKTRYDERTNSTTYTNWDFSKRIYYGVLHIDLRQYDVPYTPNGVFVFVEMLPPLIVGGDRIFKTAKMNVGNSGWFRNGRSKQWSRGVVWVMQPNGKEVDQNIEPAIALELME